MLWDSPTRYAGVIIPVNQIFQVSGIALNVLKPGNPTHNFIHVLVYRCAVVKIQISSSLVQVSPVESSFFFKLA